MPIFHRMPQYSEAWEKARLGIPTASNFDQIITPTGKPAKSAIMRKYAHTLLAERIIGRRMHTYMSPAMEAGKMLEGDAIAEFELQTRCTVDPMGFITDDQATVGCSPDGLIGEDEMLEIKCPDAHTQIGYLCGAALDQEYMCQIQGQLFVAGRKIVNVFSYHPEMTRQPMIFRVARNEEYLALLSTAVVEFYTYMAECSVKLKPLLEGDKI